MNYSGELPFMSVVICAYNSEQLIARAIQSVLAQTYPTDRYEVLVVDDGSSDGTVDIVRGYPVRLVRHATNRGLAAARSTGLDHVNGDIYVSFDDDCFVAPDWLLQLAAGYQQPNVAGVGSTIRAPIHARGLIAQFTTAAGSYDALPLSMGSSKNPIRRFVSYFITQLRLEQSSSRIEPVRELYGAMASFPVPILRLVNGWDTSLRAHEDNDVCARIVKSEPDLRFYQVSTASVMHDPDMSLLKFLRRPYLRGADNLNYYRRMNLVPPVFPSPLVWVGLAVFVTLIDPVAGFAAAVITPQILYPWWPLRAGRNHSWLSLLFAYIQLAEETATILGLVRGCLILEKKRRRLFRARRA